MTSSSKVYYIVEVLPDGKGVPHFMGKKWIPDLPDYDIYSLPPNVGDFKQEYILNAKAYQLDSDYAINDNLASFDFLELCRQFDVKCIEVPVVINLLRGKVPGKDYYLFFLLDYLSILDQESSIFTISEDIDTGKLNTPEDRGLNKIYYDRIERFIVRGDLSEHLFLCNEISKPVCSVEFMKEFEARGFKGIKFTALDDSYNYDAWEGW